MSGSDVTEALAWFRERVDVIGPQDRDDSDWARHAATIVRAALRAGDDTALSCAANEPGEACTCRHDEPCLGQACDDSRCHALAATGPRAGDTAPDDGQCRYCPNDVDRGEDGYLHCIECGWTDNPATVVHFRDEVDELRDAADAMRAAGDALIEVVAYIVNRLGPGVCPASVAGAVERGIQATQRWRSATGSPTPAEPPAVPLPVTLSSVDDVVAVCLANGLAEWHSHPTSKLPVRWGTNEHVIVGMDQVGCVLVWREGMAVMPVVVPLQWPTTILVAAIEAARGGSR